MKKKFLCIIFALLLCAVLCACGNNRTDHGMMDGDMDLLPDVTPIVSPDADDGIVDDEDGIIGNGDGHDHGENGGQTAVSPSPDAGNGTSGNGTSGTMPTTAPSESPNP